MKNNKYFIEEDISLKSTQNDEKSTGDGKKSIMGDKKRKKTTSIKDRKRKKTVSGKENKKKRTKSASKRKGKKSQTMISQSTRSKSSTGLETPKQKQRKQNASDTETPKKLVWAWQFLENDNCYHNYDKEANDLVESVYQEYLGNPNRVDVNAVQSGQWKYMVDFRNLTQTNIQHENHTVRKIRRVQIPANEVLNKKKTYKR